MNQDFTSADSASEEPGSGLQPEAIKDAAKQAWETTKSTAGDALQTGERYVRENPGTSALSVFGFGFVLGLIVGWNIAHEERPDYSRRARKLADHWGGKLNF